MVRGKYTVISTFAGGGGSSLGYKLAGFHELLAIDFDKNAYKTFNLNFDCQAWERNIQDVKAKEILDFCNINKGELDILDGSPPCQGFSTAGKRIINDDRNDLFKDFIRLINGLYPKVFVMENVSGMVKGKMKGSFIQIIKELKSCGYNVKCKLINAKYYNVPQSRQRVIFIGVRYDLNIVPTYPTPTNNIIKIKDLMPVEVTEDDRMVNNDINWEAKPYCYLLSKRVKPGENLGKYFVNKYFGFGVIDINKSSPTIIKTMAMPKSKLFIIKDGELHILPSLLLKRIGSFPDEFRFNIFDNYKLNYQNLVTIIGNSVPPKLMEAIALNIKKNILDMI